MNLKQLVNKSNKPRILAKICILIGIIGMLIYFMYEKNIIIIKNEELLGTIRLITLCILIYIILRLFYKIYNSSVLYMLKNDGILEDIDSELEDMDESDYNVAIRDKFINTKTYSIIFNKKLRVFKLEDILTVSQSKVLRREMYYYEYYSVIKLKNGKKYNIKELTYFKSTRVLLEKRGIKIEEKMEPLDEHMWYVLLRIVLILWAFVGIIYIILILKDL